MFQFRRTFKQQKPKDGSIEKFFVLLKDSDVADAATVNEGNDARTNAKKAKKKKKRLKSTSNHKQTPHNADGDINKEEYILQAIFQSNPFQKTIQKLHKKFFHLANETYSTFLNEMKKCSNRLMLEEQSGSSGGGGGSGRKKKRKRKNGSGGGMPKIAFVDDNDNGESGNASQDRQLMVTFAGVSLKINEGHKDKLHSLYRRTLQNLLGDSDHEQYLQLFPKLLFTILLRYDALEGAGESSNCDIHQTNGMLTCDSSLFRLAIGHTPNCI